MRERERAQACGTYSVPLNSGGGAHYAFGVFLPLGDTVMSLISIFKGSYPELFDLEPSFLYKNYSLYLFYNTKSLGVLVPIGGIIRLG